MRFKRVASVSHSYTMGCDERARLLKLCAITMRTYTKTSIKWQELTGSANTPEYRDSQDEIARNVVESQRLSILIDYATAAPFAIGFLETALAIEDSSNGI